MKTGTVNFKICSLLLIASHLLMYGCPQEVWAESSILSSPVTTDDQGTPLSQSNSFESQNSSFVDTQNALLELSSTPPSTYFKEVIDTAKSIFIVLEYLTGTKTLVSHEEHTLNPDNTKGDIRRRLEYAQINGQSKLTKQTKYNPDGSFLSIESMDYNPDGSLKSKTLDTPLSDTRLMYGYAANGSVQSLEKSRLSDGAKVQKIVYIQINGVYLTQQMENFDTAGNPASTLFNAYDDSGKLISKQTLNHTAETDSTYFYDAEGKMERFVQKSLLSGAPQKEYSYLYIAGKAVIHEALTYGETGTLARKETNEYDAAGTVIVKTVYDYVKSLVEIYNYRADKSLSLYTSKNLTDGKLIKEIYYIQVTGVSKVDKTLTYGADNVLVRTDMNIYAADGTVSKKIALDHAANTRTTSDYTPSGVLSHSILETASGILLKDMVYTNINGTAKLTRQKSFNNDGSLTSIIYYEYDSAARLTQRKIDDYLNMKSTLTVYHADGTSSTQTLTLSLAVPPVITIVTQNPAAENSPVNLAFSVADENAEDTLSITWEALPQGASASIQFDETSSSYNVSLSWTPSYSQAGNYPIVLHVNDGIHTVDQTVVLEVQNTNRAPGVSWPTHNGIDAGAESGLQLNEDQTVTFRALAGDPDGDPVNWSWILNGNLLLGGIAAVQDLNLDLSALSADQTHRLSIVVTDSHGALAEKYLNFSVLEVYVPPANQAPSTQLVSNPPASENNPVHIVLSVADPDGDELGISFEGLPQGALADAAFDESTSSYTVIIDWTPGFEQSGSYPIVIHADDGTVITDHSVIIQVQNTNRAPSVTDIVHNGSDADVSTAGLQLLSDATVLFQSSATDPDNESLSLVWKLDGSIQPSTTGSLNLNLSLLAPDISHELVMTATDPHGAVTESRIQFSVLPVQISNEPPLASVITHNGFDTSSAAGLQFYSTQTVTFKSDALDLDNDLIYWTWLVDNSVRSQGTLNAHAEPQENLPGLNVILSSLTPDTVHRVSLQIRDAEGTLSEKTVEFTPVAPPAAIPSPMSVSNMTGAVSIAPNHYLIDAQPLDIDALPAPAPRLTFRVGGTGITNIQLASTSPAFPAGVFGMPASAFYNSTDGFRWNPTPSQAGTYVFTFTGKDASLANVTFSVKITVDAGPICTERSEGCFILKDLYTQGLAAGNIGDFYDNRDGDHADFITTSELKKFVMPQVDATTVTQSNLVASNPYYGYVKGMVIANASTGIANSVEGSHMNIIYNKTISSSQIPGASPDPQDILVNLADKNYLWLSPGLDSYTTGQNGAGGYGDLFIGNSAAGILSSVGASTSEVLIIKAFFYTLAAFKPEVKKELLDRGLMTYTLQMLLRKNNPLVETPEDYFTAKAHPAAFNQYQFITDETIKKMILDAQAMTQAQIPPKVTFQVLEKNIGDVSTTVKLSNGTRQISTVREFRFETDNFASYLHLGAERDKRFVIRPGSTGVPGQSVTYKVAALNGHGITINDLGDGTFEVIVPYQGRQAIYQGSDIYSNRVDIGIFADNGSFVSAPAIISINTRADEIREYDADGRLLEHAYNIGDTDIGVVQPVYYNEAVAGFRAFKTEIDDWTGLIGMALPMTEESVSSVILKDALNHVTDSDGEPLGAPRVQELFGSFLEGFTPVYEAYLSQPDDAHQYAVRTLLDKPIEGIGVSIRHMMLEAINHIKNDPGFYFDHQDIINQMMAPVSLDPSAEPVAASTFNLPSNPIAAYSLARSKSTVDQLSLISYTNGVATLKYTGTTTTSEAGLNINFIDPTNNLVNPVDFTQMFPNGLDLMLSSPSITSVILDIQSANPNRQSQITLSGITSSDQTWHIDLAKEFELLDLTQIKFMRVRVVGQMANAELKIGLGGLTPTPSTVESWYFLPDDRSTSKTILSKLLLSSTAVTLSGGQYHLDRSKLTAYETHQLQQMNHLILDNVVFAKEIDSPLGSGVNYVPKVFPDGLHPSGIFEYSKDTFVYDENGEFEKFLRLWGATLIECTFDSTNDKCTGY